MAEPVTIFDLRDDWRRRGNWIERLETLVGVLIVLFFISLAGNIVFFARLILRG